MEFGDLDRIVGHTWRSLDPPWHRTLVPLDWSDASGVEIEGSQGRSRKKLVLKGVVVKDEVSLHGTSTHLLTETSLTDYIGTSWGLLSGRARLIVIIRRPAQDFPSAVSGSLIVDGVSTPYRELDPYLEQANEFGPLDWVIAFHDTDADVTIAGIETPEIPTAWRRIDTQPLRDARRYVLGFP